MQQIMDGYDTDDTISTLELVDIDSDDEELYELSAELERIIIHFKKCRLKTYDTILKKEILITKLTKDKKNFQNNINFSFIDKIGSSIFYKKLDKNKVYKILQKI